jgi:hypothetical protein
MFQGSYREVRAVDESSYGHQKVEIVFDGRLLLVAAVMYRGWALSGEEADTDAVTAYIPATTGRASFKEFCRRPFVLRDVLTLGLARC